MLKNQSHKALKVVMDLDTEFLNGRSSLINRHDSHS